MRGRIMHRTNLTNRPPTALFCKRGLLPCRKRGGGGTLDSLEVGVTMLTRDYEGGGDYLAEDLECARVEYLFTYLAGVGHSGPGHYGSRGALATIEAWDD